MRPVLGKQNTNPACVMLIRTISVRRGFAGEVGWYCLCPSNPCSFYASVIAGGIADSEPQDLQGESYMRVSSFPCRTLDGIVWQGLVIT